MHEKELLSLIRNSRTWWIYLLSLLVPLGLFFMLFRFSGQLIRQQMEDDSKSRYKVAWVAQGTDAQTLKDKLELHLQIELTEDYKELELMEAIQNDSLDAALVIAENFDSSIVQKQKGQITLHYKSSRSAAGLLEDLVSDYRDDLGAKNLAELELSKDLLEPIYISERNYFSMSEMIDGIFKNLQRSIASLLAILFLIFGSISARYALRNNIWKELDGGQLDLLAKTAVSRPAIFRTKLLWTTIFVWENMLLALLGFSLALSFDQEGAMQNLMIQFRELFPWSRFGILALLALPFAFLLTNFYSFLGLWLGQWKTLVSNLSFSLLLIGFLVFGLLPFSGIVGSLLPFFNQVPLAIDLLQNNATLTQFSVSSATSIGIGILLYILSFMRFNSEGFLLNIRK